MKKYAIILFIFVSSASAAAYTRITLSGGQSPKWQTMPISYYINEQGLSQISNGSEFRAVRAAFQTWQNVQTADVRFNDRGTTPLRYVDLDGFNIVTFADDSSPLGSSTIAATFQYFDTSRSSFQDADIVFNPALQFSTSGEAGRFDIQSILTHEIGHMLGLDHAGLISSVMAPFGVDSQLDQRTLQYDDIVGITEIYPRASSAPATGQIRGTILAGTAPVFGAHVVAIDSDGTSVVSTMSQPDGAYTIRFLPPGSYRVVAEPLDNPVIEGHLGGGPNSFYRSLKTDFGTTYFGNVATLTEAGTINVTVNASANANIQTLPRSSTRLNVTRPAFPLRVARGRRETLRIGGEDITAGISITASSPELFLDTPSFGGRLSSVAPTSASTDVSASDSTALGPKNIGVNRGGAGAIGAGIVVVTDPRPENMTVSPSSGEGGSFVTIAGSNFRAGAQVFFGGLAASGVQVVNSGTILATTPSNSPGAANIVVFNSDGTWGVRPQAFTYNAELPVVTRVSPTSGPPTTTVAIEGARFDTRTQNIDVRFNGISGRVISATSNLITTIVPFGATSGPVTVSVFGNVTIGPGFTVTNATASTNVARNVFNFVDATAGQGGTNLSFGSTDDAVAFSTLPFNFSLFRDIYLEGSRITIATNGWLSLEAAPIPEFQNASLPAQTVTRPGGSTGTVPPSLIAPFWDDLVLKPGSTVSTLTIGVAPNRQFIVEWSALSIVDEEGRDLNVSVTFEAILFEGSNDIQFLYRFMNGPRSDGSSATVGAQDLKRITAIESAFNRAFASSGFFTTYRFQNGGYAEERADTTAPAKPVVADGGTLTRSSTELFASWTASDAESGIREYQYAVGTTPGGADVRPFTSTTQSSAVVTGLNLQLSATYYFAVRATNGMGLISDVGLSDGIRFDPAFQPQIKVIPSASLSGSEFSGIALLAPTAMSVVLTALDSNGLLIGGSGIRNPTSVNLTAGRQYARLVPEIFGLQTFDGWIEVEASGTGLGIFTATGSWDMTQLDGSVARDTSADFVLFHAGASAMLVNPSARAANVTIANFGTTNSQSLTIPARGRTTIAVPGVIRVRSSEAIAAIERSSSMGKLAISAAVPISDAVSTLVFPHAVLGGGYTSTVTLVNVTGTPLEVAIAFGLAGGTLRLDPNATVRLPVAELLNISGNTIRVGALRVTGQVPVFGGSAGTLVGVLDIENGSGAVIMGARPAATEFFFPHVAHGNGLFTGLAFTTGDRAASITIDIYEAGGGMPNTRTIAIEANQQLGRLISELVPAVTTQMGGYIRIRSDQPIWSWEIYGSDSVMASGPPL